MTLDVWSQLGIIAGVMALLMLALWVIQVRTGDAGVVDFGWSLGLGLSAIFCAVTGDGVLERRVLIGAMGGVWGLRLAWHILTDRVLRGEEDGRYQMLRGALGERINPFLLVFFEAQALSVPLLAVPFALAAHDPEAPFGILDVAAGLLWLTGIIGESIADAQLARFKRDPANKGKTCRAGLWRYSRHPNYFFEWLMWCSYGLAAVSTAYGWLGFLSPLIILVLVLKVTGIPPTERRALQSRGEDYRRYQRTTSAFIPWFPRKEEM